MATINGIDGAIKAVTTGGTPAVISELKGWAVEETADTVETTVMGNTSKTFATTLKSWTGTCEVNYEPGNAVQMDMLIGEPVDVEFYPNTVSNSTKFTGTALVTSHSRSGAMGDLVGSSISLQGSGALTVVA